MKWLTLKEIRAAAKKSDLAALECSKLHWQQMYNAMPEELRAGFKKNVVDDGPERCACCQRWASITDNYVACKGCVLGHSATGCCGGLYSEACDELGKKRGRQRYYPACIKAVIDFIDLKIKELKL